MDDITMMSDPRGRWVMMCPCGAAEIRAPDGPSWASFELHLISGSRYRVTCRDCGHTTEHFMHNKVDCQEN